KMSSDRGAAQTADGQRRIVMNSFIGGGLDPGSLLVSLDLAGRTRCSSRPDGVPRVVAQRRDICYVVKAHLVRCFFANGKYTLFRDGGAEYLVDEGIGALEKRLHKHGFVRANRGVLVNSTFIGSLRRDGRFLEL